MKTLMITIAASMVLVISGYAKLGDTRAQTEENWGVPVDTGKNVDGESTASYRKGAQYSLNESYNQEGKAISSDYFFVGIEPNEDMLSKMVESNIKDVAKYTTDNVKTAKFVDKDGYAYRIRFFGNDYIEKIEFAPKVGDISTCAITFCTSESGEFARIKKFVQENQFTP
jgi:uncharacterized protein YxeA